MTTGRVGLACFVLLVSGALVQAQVLPADELVRKLTDGQHRVREQALVELVQVGAPAVRPLLSAALSKDPELAWRATEAVQILVQTVDIPREAAVKKELVQAGRSTNKDEAALAKKVLAQWPLLRHHYAAAQLELLGAEIADFGEAPHLEHSIGGGVMFGGGGFFAPAMPVMMEVEEEVLVEEMEVAEEEVLRELDEAPLPKRALFDGLFKAFGRAAGGIARRDDDVADAVAEKITETILERAAKPAKPRDVEFIEEPPVDAAAMEGEEFFDEDFGVLPPPAVADTIVLTADDLLDEPAVSDDLAQGTLRIGKGWRGGDAGLDYVAHLQGIHTVVLRDAPLTDAAIAPLQKLRSMQHLTIHHTRLSSATLLKFRAQRPNVIVTALGPAVLGVAGSDRNGLLVQQVTPESGARRAGIDEQDVITKVAGLKVTCFNDVTLALYDKQPGQKVRIDFVRGGKAQTVDVALGARESDAPTVSGNQVEQQQLLPGPSTIFRAFDGRPPAFAVPLPSLPE